MRDILIVLIAMPVIVLAFKPEFDPMSMALGSVVALVILLGVSLIRHGGRGKSRLS